MARDKDIHRPQSRNAAELRQEINAEHVVAGGAVGDVGEPERQRRPHVGADLILPAEGEQGGEVAGRAAIEHHRHRQPHQRLQRDHEQNHEPRPGADQFDNQGGETHQTPEDPKAGSKASRIRP
jgi:hypothetical protein